jgi:hypothetical protein
MGDGIIKGKQLTDIKLSPDTTPLNINSYTVSATGSGKQLVNKEYLEDYVDAVTYSLQEITDVGNTSSNDIEITDFSSGIILRSPDNSRWRITINDEGQLIAEQL